MRWFSEPCHLDLGADQECWWSLTSESLSPAFRPKAHTILCLSILNILVCDVFSKIGLVSIVQFSGFFPVALRFLSPEAGERVKVFSPFPCPLISTQGKPLYLSRSECLPLLSPVSLTRVLRWMTTPNLWGFLGWELLPWNSKALTCFKETRAVFCESTYVGYFVISLSHLVWFPISRKTGLKSKLKVHEIFLKEHKRKFQSIFLNCAWCISASHHASLLWTSPVR